MLSAWPHVENTKKLVAQSCTAPHLGLLEGGQDLPLPQQCQRMLRLRLEGRIIVLDTHQGARLAGQSEEVLGTSTAMLHIHYHLERFPVEVQALVAQAPVAEELGSDMRAASCRVYPGIDVLQYGRKVASPSEGVYAWHPKIL
jgi:hypothetical protein